MATNRVQTGIRFEIEMLAKITYISRKNRRSLNAQLEFLAQKCIEEYELDKGEIKISDDEKYIR
ncbi:MAG: Arc family DNA-binding protein [Defluviitaleaceae bacterium]|nr:Arc family DNA-binding protein [Defluviitaleaceae bacterium]